MKRFLAAAAVALVAAGVAVAAVGRHDSADPPTTASLMPAYVEAAKYWSTRSPGGDAPAAATSQSPPTTSPLMDAYVQAARQWLP
jgi:hypothetical protein